MKPATIRARRSAIQTSIFALIGQTSRNQRQMSGDMGAVFIMTPGTDVMGPIIRITGTFCLFPFLIGMDIVHVDTDRITVFVADSDGTVVAGGTGMAIVDLASAAATGGSAMMICAPVETLEIRDMTLIDVVGVATI